MNSVNVSSDHLNFIPKIYDTMTNSGNWPNVLDEFAHFCGASDGTLIFGDNVFPEISSRLVTPNFASVVAEGSTYDEQFADDEYRAFCVVKQYPPQTWITDEEAFGKPVDEIACTLYQREHFGVDRRAGAFLNETPIWFDGVSLNYKLGRGNITDEEAKVSQIFLPHLAKVLEINRPFALLKNRYQAILSVLDYFDIGVAITNREGEVIIKNHEAERALDDNNGLALSRENKFVLRSSEHKNQLSTQIAAAADTKNPDEFDTVLAVPKRDGGLPWLLEVTPMSSLSGEIDGAFSGAAVFITDPSKKEVISTSGMEALFKLTSAESEVCSMLAKGSKIEEVADTRNVSPQTVRSQVKALFAKTDTTSQLELVRLALKVNLPVKRVT